ncbi:MAG: MerR family transcriptional regulator [Chloroflexota bacterium]
MKPSELSNILGVSASTIRAWSANEYKRYLTPSGQGGSGASRSFTDLDARILWRVVSLKQQGFTAEDVHADLQRQQAAEWDDLPPMPDTVGAARVAVVPQAAADNALEYQRRALQREIAMLQERVSTLETKLDAEHDKSDKQLRELADLQKLIGSLETEVNLWRSGRLKPSE